MTKSNDECRNNDEREKASQPSSFVIVIRHSAADASSRQLIFWLFRLATYFVLACATYIFLDIGIKGSRTVFTSTPPFINLPFLTEPPQTLYVFDYEGKKLTLSDRQFRDWKAAHPGVEVNPIERRLFRRRHLAVHRRDRAARHWLDGGGVAHRDQQRDLPERIQPATAA